MAATFHTRKHLFRKTLLKAVLHITVIFITAPQQIKSTNIPKAKLKVIHQLQNHNALVR